LTSKALVIALIAPSVLAAELTQATVDAFDRYIAELSRDFPVFEVPTSQYRQTLLG
jgi:hypothetical protein